MRTKLQKWCLVFVSVCLVALVLTNLVEAKSDLDQPESRHVLERISFGLNSQQIKQAEKLGVEAYLQSQLNPDTKTVPAQLKPYLNSVNPEPIKLLRRHYAINKKLKDANLPRKQQEKIKKARSKYIRNARETAMDAHLARAIYARDQLQEVMVDFWFNHFNVFAGKGPVAHWVNDYENKIRANAFGKFRDLLEITASHPAMLIYLDNHQSRVTVDPQTNQTISNINENYARELMELHTLGVDGGYSQADIVELARIFTGWGVDVKDRNQDGSGFFFFRNRHDRGTKSFLGQTINDNGIAEGEQALDILAAHPATAHHISYELAQYFVSDRPPSSLVDKLSAKFTETDGDIKAVLNTLLHSPEFLDPQYYGQKFKTPYQYLVSLIRMGEIEQADLKRIRGMLTNLSMPVYMCSAPTGYKNTQSAWLNSQGMLQRIGYAAAIARSQLNREDPVNDERLETNMRKLSKHTQEVIEQNPPQLRSSLILGSPEAMYR